MSDKEKIITKDSDFDDIHLDLDDITPAVTNETSPLPDTPVVTKSLDVHEDPSLNAIPDLDSIDLDDDVALTTPKVDHVQEELKSTPKPLSLDELEISIDDLETPPVVKDDKIETPETKLQNDLTVPDPVKTPPLENTVPIAKKKPGRPRVVAKSDKPSSPSNEKALNGMLVPDLDISKIKRDKYQTRQTLRSAEESAELMERIKSQGQIEAIHVLKEGEDYQLIAGFGRVAAMLALSMPTIKAIVYDKLDESDIYTISTATNEARVALSDWDKISSVGVFQVAHSDMPKTAPFGTRSIQSVFGISTASVYRYLNFFEYFIKIPEYVEIFKQIKIPMFCIEGLFDNKENIKDHKRFAEFLKNSHQTNKRTFESLLETLIAEIKMKDQMIAEELKIENLDIEKVDDVNTTSITNNEPDLKETTDENEKKVLTLLNAMTKHIIETEQSMMEMFTIDNYKLYIKPDQGSAFSKRVATLGKMILKMI